jgi:hypothetical protein
VRPAGARLHAKFSPQERDLPGHGLGEGGIGGDGKELQRHGVGVCVKPFR